MAILVRCECGRQLQAKDEFAGRMTRCPDCNRDLLIPDTPGTAPDAPPIAGPASFDPEFGPFPETRRTSAMAIASLVLGLLSFCTCVLTGIPALILGKMGLSEIRKSKGQVGGEGLAIAGMVTGGIGSLLSVLIIGVYIALLLPAFSAARDAARRAQCMNNLKQIGLALHNFNSNQGRFPAAAIRDKDGKPLLSWRVAILPYIEQQPLYSQFKLDEPWDSPHNKALISRMPSTYACPSDPGAPVESGRTTYRIFVGPGTLFESDEGASFADITDGLSNTLAVVESTQAIPWTQPEELAFVPNGPLPPMGSQHSNGFNALLADGAVKFIRKTVPESTLRAMITRNGGEVVPMD